MQGVYKITNLLNNKCYIGSAKNIEKRIKYAHKGSLNKNKHWNEHLQNAWNKYGESNFIFETIEEVNNLDILNDREQYWIDYYKSQDREYGYNIARADRKKITEEEIEKCRKRMLGKTGENHPAYGFRHTVEAKNKISEFQKSFKKKPMSKETKEKISNIQKGKNYIEKYGQEKADEIIQKQSRTYIEKYGLEKAEELITYLQKSYEEKYGLEKANEIKNKMSLKHKGFKHSEETKQLCSEAKLGSKNPNYKEVPEDMQNLIVELYVKNNFILVKNISEITNISIYKIKRILIERGIYVKK